MSRRITGSRRFEGPPKYAASQADTEPCHCRCVHPFSKPQSHSSSQRRAGAVLCSIPQRSEPHHSFKFGHKTDENWESAAAVPASRVAMAAILAAAHTGKTNSNVTNVTEVVLATSSNTDQPAILTSIRSTKCTAWQDDAFLRVISGGTYNYHCAVNVLL